MSGRSLHVAVSTIGPAAVSTQIRAVDQKTSEAVAAELTGSVVEIGALWELCTRVEYDRHRLADGLAGWLGPPDGLRVLDAACGGGLPALDLYARGYDITCTDASEAMLTRFRASARRCGLDVSPLQRRWENLGREFPDQFDAVLCRGSSLIYAGTWDMDAPPDRGVLERSVSGLAACVAPRGRLYVDTTKKEDLRRKRTCARSYLELVDGQVVTVDECIDADAEAGVRTWSAVVEFAGRQIRFRRRSHLLAHETLVAMLRSAGLVDVRPVDIDGENYDVYVARRAATADRGARPDD
jgi:SAM-dependent methyltransferase